MRYKHQNVDTLLPGTTCSFFKDISHKFFYIGANTYIRTCNGLIAQFKKDLAEKQDLPESRRLHLKAVCDILAAFLKSACDIFTEQKAIRVQREMEFQKMSRLEVKARQGISTNSIFITFFQ